jgi:hypothetical protein
LALTDDLERIAAAAARYGTVTGVLAAESAPGVRSYLVSLADEDARSWVALDADGRPLEEREAVRETASIVALCEVAGDLAGGGDVAELRGQLARLRVTESPPGIAEAEQAALVLERAIGIPPQVASAAYLDEVGMATRDLERALGDHGSPFTNAMKSATGAVDDFVHEVESHYKLPLSK